MANILVVDDETDIRELVCDILEDEGYTVKVAENGEAANAILSTWTPDLAFVDIWMPDIDGISLLNQWVEAKLLDFPAVIMSGHGTIDTAVEATRLGAFDYIEKPLSMTKLLETVGRALGGDNAAEEAATAQDLPYSLIGRSAVVMALREKVERLANSDSPVVFTGPAGSGKTTCVYELARAHAKPMPVTRWQRPQAGKSSAEISQQLAADLTSSPAGLFFIPHIDELPVVSQDVLADWLLNAKVGKRICMSASADLQTLREQSRLSDRLFSVLSPFQCPVPALNAHLEDVPELLRYFVDDYSEREQLPFKRFSVAAQNYLRNQAWPGNVRQLQLLLKRILTEVPESNIEIENIRTLVEMSQSEETLASGTAGFDVDLSLSLRDAREAFERHYLALQLKECDGNVAGAAKKAGMERTHLYRKLRQLGLDIRDI